MNWRRATTQLLTALALPVATTYGLTAGWGLFGFVISLWKFASAGTGLATGGLAVGSFLFAVWGAAGLIGVIALWWITFTFRPDPASKTVRYQLLGVGCGVLALLPFVVTTGMQLVSGRTTPDMHTLATVYLLAVGVFHWFDLAKLRANQSLQPSAASGAG
jgi:hypothetical protein